MRLGVLFSGGKDSCFALSKAKDDNEVACLISLYSSNSESFMFHVPNIEMTNMQAESLGIPLIRKETEGEKESELKDLEDVVLDAKEKYKIEGIVTGAVRSIYQATRIQKICKKLGLWCFNPIWLNDEVQLLKDMLDAKMEIVISGVFAYPLGRELLGKKLDLETIEKLEMMQKKHSINPAGEGGELETTVLDMPLFRKKIIIEKSSTNYDNYSGTFAIKQARLVDK
ncbi:MAG: diphthine--ammonia ligase [Candidatus Aenigmarchaeota archaeon]|nr:diphthine--ammonia ligase [Candidatus Aenigmarchaeota archaeon]